MDPDLLAYVLKTLDPSARAEAEGFLRDHPEAQAQVDALRQTLEPLSWDRGEHAPPGLAERTLQQFTALPLPGEQRSRLGLPGRRFLEVAAMLMITATALGLGMTWIGRLRVQQSGGEPSATHLVACKENLRKLYVSLSAYSDAHDRQFPNVNAAVGPSRGAGGLVFSVLKDNKALPPDMQIACPGASGAVPTPVGIAEVKAMNDAAFQSYVQTLPNCYAYSLGYRQGGQLIGPHLEDGKPSSLMPLMADSSPANPLQGGHSMSHGGAGQNVLYGDGHVTFCQSRFVGFNQDDIYLNRAKQVAAGYDWGDAILTSGPPP